MPDLLEKASIMQILQGSLATEIVCVLRYRSHYYLARGLESPAIREEFKKHSDDELEHADKLAQRIIELGGRPEFNPNIIVNQANVTYESPTTLGDMIRANLVAEQIVIQAYGEAIIHIGEHDPTTTQILIDILEKEEEHSNDLEKLL